MVILHPRAGNQYRDQLDEAQPNIRLFEWETFFFPIWYEGKHILWLTK